MEQFDLRAILVVFGAITIITGLATEILKKVFWRDIPTSLLTIIVAEALTLGSGFIYATLMGTTVLWWHMLAAVVAGRGVAYAAMASYDKYVEIKKSWAKIKGEKNEREKRQNGEGAGVVLHQRPHGLRSVGHGRQVHRPHR